MMTQKQIWVEEHLSGRQLPSMSNEDPSEMVVRFVKFLKNKKLPLRGQAIDIGAGKGRNAVYLASLGFNVHCVDYVQAVLSTIDNRAKKKGIRHRLQLWCARIDEEWNFASNFFDIAIDCYSSIDIETINGRKKYLSELYRTLKPGGYAMISVVSSDDEIEKELIASHPGREKNSSIWPDTGKFQKNYDEDELREFYMNFEIITIEKIKKPAHKLNRNYQATNFYLVLKKGGENV
jgi:ubiquinone/menaquinone biosynthesis C-methylase UbiE